MDHPIASEVEYGHEIEEIADDQHSSFHSRFNNGKKISISASLIINIEDLFRASKQNWSKCDTAWWPLWYL